MKASSKELGISAQVRHFYNFLLLLVLIIWNLREEMNFLSQRKLKLSDVTLITTSLENNDGRSVNFMFILDFRLETEKKHASKGIEITREKRVVSDIAFASKMFWRRLITRQSIGLLATKWESNTVRVEIKDSETRCHPSTFKRFVRNAQRRKERERGERNVFSDVVSCMIGSNC